MAYDIELPENISIKNSKDATPKQNIAKAAIGSRNDANVDTIAAIVIQLAMSTPALGISVKTLESLKITTILASRRRDACYFVSPQEKKQRFAVGMLPA